MILILSKILLAKLSRAPERQLPAIPNHFSSGHLGGFLQFSWFPDLLEVVATVPGEDYTKVTLSFFFLFFLWCPYIQWSHKQLFVYYNLLGKCSSQLWFSKWHFLVWENTFLFSVLFTNLESDLESPEVPLSSL